MAVDINAEALAELEKNFGINTQKADVSNAATLTSLVKDYDLVVGAVPGFMGFQTVRNVIRAGKNMVDISFFPQDPFRLHEEAEKNDVSVAIDCGVAPGMSNIFLGYYDEVMDVKKYKCLVGGLPKIRE